MFRLKNVRKHQRANVFFFKDGKSYEELKQELGDVACPVRVTPVCM